MNIKTKLVIALLTISLTGLVHAGNFNQKIYLNITSKGDGIDISETNHVCFTTTDFFDGSHCGDGASNYYSHGPKNWKFYHSKKNPRYIYETDRSCNPMFYTQYISQTPNEDGRLDIYVTAYFNSADDHLTKKTIPKTMLVKYTNCHYKWTSQSYHAAD